MTIPNVEPLRRRLHASGDLLAKVHRLIDKSQRRLLISDGLLAARATYAADAKGWAPPADQ